MPLSTLLLTLGQVYSNALFPQCLHSLGAELCWAVSFLCTTSYCSRSGSQGAHSISTNSLRSLQPSNLLYFSLHLWLIEGVSANEENSSDVPFLFWVKI